MVTPFGPLLTHLNPQIVPKIKKLTEVRYGALN